MRATLFSVLFAVDVAWFRLTGNPDLLLCAGSCLLCAWLCARKKTRNGPAGRG